MNQQLALRQLQATTSFTFVEDKVLLRSTTLLKAVSRLQRQTDLPLGSSNELAGLGARKQSSSASH